MVNSGMRAGYLEKKHRYFHLRDTAGQERDYHFHEFDKIVVLLSGRVDYAVEDCVTALHPHDILLVRRRMIHKALIDKSEPYDRIIIYLNSDHYSSLLPEAGLNKCFTEADRLSRCLLTPDKRQWERISRIFADYEDTAEREGRLDDAVRETLILRLLAELNGMTAETPEAAVKYDAKIADTLNYINDNLSSELSVDLLAERIYLSRYYFMRLFRENTGTTVHAYIRQKRLFNASRLIREGMSATAAAAASGFGDYSVFHRAYREVFGMNPGTISRATRKQEE